MAEVISSPPANFNASKRVSFGDNPVRTFLYEKDDDATPILHRQSYTDPDAPVARVTVTEQETVDIPTAPIAPPRSVGDEFHRPISPPLPWARKMDTEHENPFRPQEVLYHEVDPIVEAYLHKPFPPSNPGSASGTPVKQNGASNGHAAVSSSPSYLQNGLSKEQLMYNEKLAQQEPLLQQRQETPVKRQSRDKSAHADDDPSDLPAAGKVELVHINKKKCGCCSLQ